ncbi:DUF2314 domain-containing protein [Pseudomonas sp. PDM16]|uniref:YegJ family protein n=1 Tax=Pseudomonas sp. PDM16 TaxID=2769292 RepID=UPI001783589F|nr:DUF2314 domain-containing protein [Pseudomonas sp. PDM16]MBD9416734.1 DUF2314 domain-containing protein [Pseudomonas sp. PDM16]
MADGVFEFDSEDQRIQFAIEEAQSTLKAFFDAYLNPKPNQEAFLLKVQFEIDGEIEHIWMADIDPSAFPLHGTIANEPELPGLSFMQRVTFHPSQVTDWMYVEDGFLVGGYTTQVIRSGLTPDERAEYDAEAPYKFRGYPPNNRLSPKTHHSEHQSVVWIESITAFKANAFGAALTPTLGLKMLSKLEDGILVLCEGEPFTLALARVSLSTWLETKFTDKQVKQAALRLSRLKLAKWHYYEKGKYKVSYRLKAGSDRVTLKATINGEEYLSQVRELA